MVGVSVLAGTLFVIGLVWWLVRTLKGRNYTTLPKQTDWGATLSDVESDTIVRIAEALYDDMKGLNVFSRNSDVYYELNSASDRVLVGVSNYFSDRYGGSLYEWLDGEAFSWNDFALRGCVDAIMGRMEKLGLK